MVTKLTIAIAAAVCSLLWPAARAAEEPDQAPPTNASKALRDWVRSGSLELPGVTACHQCEWRPKPHQMAAADRCGIAADGNARVAEFECGFSEDCQRVCNFVRCLER